MVCICQARTQDIDGNNDSFCIECWHESTYDKSFPSRSYLDRQSCMDENLLSVDEFDEAIRKRNGVITCGKNSSTSMQAGI